MSPINLLHMQFHTTESIIKTDISKKIIPLSHLYPLSCIYAGMKISREEETCIRFPEAAITNYYNLGNLKQQNCILWVLGSGGWDPGGPPCPFPLLVAALPFQGLHCVVLISASTFMSPSLCVIALCSLSQGHSSWQRGFTWIIQGNLPILTSLTYLHLQALYLKRETFTNHWNEDLRPLGGHCSPYSEMTTVLRGKCLNWLRSTRQATRGVSVTQCTAERTFSLNEPRV